MTANINLGCYILDGHETVPVDDVVAWAEWIEVNRDQRKVKQSLLLNDTVRVSTVFLGINHGSSHDIHLFETMVFGGEHDEVIDRCDTWDNALIMHQDMCNLMTQK